MQSLNDDMDELFRRASDEYPLNTNGADWNKVLQQLHHTNKDLPDDNHKKKNYNFLWLLLLLPVGFICGKYVGNSNKNITAQKNTEVSVDVADHFKKEKNSKSTTTTSTTKREADNKTLHPEAANNKSKDSKVNYAARNSFHSNKDNKSLDIETKNRNSVSKNGTNVSLDKTPKTDAIIETSLLKKDKTNKSSPSSVDKAYNKETGNSKLAKDRSVTNNSSAIADNAAGTKPQKDTSALNSSDKRVDTALNQNASTPSNKKNITKKQSDFKRKMYYSILAGPDLSTVKHQKFSNVGYSVGLMFGYQFSKKISVEASALWDRKNYYANGDDLDTSKLALPAHSIVSKVDGYCDMIEIPVNIKYDLIAKPRYSWFISAGASSYLMLKEDYTLTYTRYNQQYVKDYGYNNSSRDWFSILNVSAGYQKTLGKSTNIRLAPYLKLPLKGVGIGKLPIKSVGIYVSMSRSVF